VERLRSYRREPTHLKLGKLLEHREGPSASSFEPHYSVQVLAELWRLDESTVRRIFENVPGVLKLANDRSRNGKGVYCTLRIPASVAEREYQRRLNAESIREGS
jgi:hypothetical protein